MIARVRLKSKLRQFNRGNRMKAEMLALGLGGERREWRGDLGRFSEMPKHSLWGSLSRLLLQMRCKQLNHATHLSSVCARADITMGSSL